MEKKNWKREAKYEKPTKHILGSGDDDDERKNRLTKEMNTYLNKIYNNNNKC